MLTVLEALKLSEEFLEKKGIESPRLNAELMLADILNLKRLNLYLEFERPLSEDEKTKYREFLKRRGNFEPLQYIIGEVEFYGFNFKVDKSLLIPRQETEILIETVINNIDKNEHFKVLDIGTGSGNVAICLSKYLPESDIITIDINDKAIKLAEENAEENKVKEKITFYNTGINNGKLFERFDVIVSNPPYISKDDFDKLNPEIKNYEPKDALTDFGDGYKFFKLISEKAKELLNKNGKLFFEIGDGQSFKVKKIMKENGFSNIKIVKDYLEIDRVIYGELN